MFYIQQTNKHDCGFTCLKIMLANLNKDENYLYLPSPFDNDNNVSLLDIVNEGKKYGLTFSPLHAEIKEGIEKEKDFPFIAVIKNEESLHMIYVYKINKKYVYFYDPLGEFKKVTINVFKESWTGDVLKVKEFAPQKANFEKPNLLKNKERIISLLFILLSGVSALLGVYFINKNSYFFLPAIFFSLMIIFEIILKKYNVILLSRIDERIGNKYKDIKDKQYFTFHMFYEKYKSSLLVSDLSFFSSLLIVLITTIIMMLNDRINVIYVGVNVLLAIIYYLFISPFIEKKEREIERKEAYLLDAKNLNFAESIMQDTRHDAYRMSSINNVVTYSVIFLELLTAFIMMMVNEVVNVSYIICYLVMEIYLYQNMVRFLKQTVIKDQNNNLLNKLVSLFEKNSN